MAWRHEPRRLPGLPTAGLILVITVLASNGIVALIPEYRLPLFALMDCACAVYFLRHAVLRMTWEEVLGYLFVAQIALHIMEMTDEIAGISDPHKYVLFLNATFVLQLSCVAAPAFISILHRRGRLTGRV